MNDKILFVDDDPSLLAAFQRNLRKQFACDTAQGGAEALEMIRTKGPYALVLADMNMPGMQGIELLERVRQLSPDTVRMMLTGNADQQTAVEAVNRGQVFRFLNKPAPPEILVPALEDGLKHYSLHRLEREILEGTVSGSIKLLTDVLGMVAPDALGRGQRLRDSMSRFAQHLGVASRWELELGALLSSIGCAAIPPSILQKVGTDTPLTEVEMEVMQRVPQIGRDLLVAIPRLAEVAEIVHYQHKRFDGSGFPTDAVAGEVIPMGSRMLKILNDRLALEADGVVKVRAHQRMQARSGYYDPFLLDHCFKCFGDFLVPAISHDRAVTTLKVDKLKPGDVVVSDIMTKDGMTLVGAGGSLTAMIIARLVNYRQIGKLKEPMLVQQLDPAGPGG